MIYINQIIPKTIQGEGDKAGTPTTLIRVSGCNLTCSFCDTKYSWVQDKQSNTILSNKNIDEFIECIKSYNMSNILLTGGEPFIYANEDIFWYMINRFGHNLEIETNGSLLNLSNREMLSKYLLGKINISPKLNKEFYKIKEQYDSLIYNLNEFFRLFSCNPEQFILKIVYDPTEEENIDKFLNDINYKHIWKNIYFMPLTPNIDKYENFEQFLNGYHENCLKTVRKCIELKVRYSPRLHIEIFRNDRDERV